MFEFLKKKKAVQMDESANPISLGFINALSGYLPNPDEILREKGGNFANWRKMQDAHLDSVRDKRKRAVTSLSFQFTPKEADPEKTKIIESHLNKIGLRTVIRSLLSAPEYGFAACEVIWGIVDGIYLPIAIKDRNQEWFKFSPNGELLIANASGKTTPAPPRKFIIATNDQSATNPYGKSLLSRCYWPLTFKKTNLQFWIMFAERFGFPRAIGKLPGEASDGDKRSMLSALKGLIRDGIGVMSINSSYEFIESSKGGAGTLPHPEIVKWADAEMSKAFLGETLSTEQQDTGSYALGNIHNSVRLEAAQDDCIMIEESINQLLQWIWEINFPSEPAPYFEFLTPTDWGTARLERDLKLKQLGVNFTQKYFEDNYDLSEDYIAEISLPNTNAMFAEGAPPALQTLTESGSTGSLAFSAAPQAGKPRNAPLTTPPSQSSALTAELTPPPAQDAFRAGGGHNSPRNAPKYRNTVENFSNGIAKTTERLCDPVYELVKNANSIEEVRDGLISLYAQIPVETVAEEMQAAFTAADLAGHLEILQNAGM